MTAPLLVVVSAVAFTSVLAIRFLPHVQCKFGYPNEMLFVDSPGILGEVSGFVGHPSRPREPIPGCTRGLVVGFKHYPAAQHFTDDVHLGREWDLSSRPY